MIAIVYIILLLAVLLPGAKIAGKGTLVEQPFSAIDSKGMQGFFALCILVHHVSLRVRFFDHYSGDMVFFEDIGTLLVGFFFLCSGYGLYVSFQNKEHYLDTFMKRRMVTVMVPFFICNYAYMFTALMLGHQFTTKELVASFFGFRLLNDHMWFAVEIMIIYLLFYITFRYVKKDVWRFLLIGCMLLVMCIISFLLGHDPTEDNVAYTWFRGEWWYNTTPLFFVGLLMGKFRSELIRWVRKYYKVLFPVVVVAFIGFYKATMYMIQVKGGYWTETELDPAYGNKLCTLAVQVPMVAAFEVLVVLIMLKVRFQNVVLRFLGTISLEMILLENVFMLYFSERDIQLNVHVYCMIVIACTIGIATVINWIKQLILEKK